MSFVHKAWKKRQASSGDASPAAKRKKKKAFTAFGQDQRITIRTAGVEGYRLELRNFHEGHWQRSQCILEHNGQCGVLGHSVQLIGKRISCLHTGEQRLLRAKRLVETSREI